ncbi:hypothetical protein HPULCUR_002341 [Helicostylum pulchrum]|uniref:Kelch repeat protein n=1 Tax=Helicostylum pulchrum TaxID=562976 RepID=A0ABP9XQD3_9FUNG
MFACGYVGGQIYCFGGDTAPTFSQNQTMDENIYSLNIKAFAGQKSEIMISQWNKILPDISFETGKRRRPTSIVLSDGKRLLVQGGFNPLEFKYLDQTIIYDTASNTWAKGSAYSVDNVGVRQIYVSTVVNLPNDLVGFYGGMEQLANISAPPEIAGNGNAVTFNSGNASYAGFSRFTTHNTDLGTWSPFSPQGNTLLDFYPVDQTATINPSTGKIYYLGGNYYTTTSNWARVTMSFNWAVVFDTKSGTWSNNTMNGNLPAARMYHTANLLPNSQDIILYGGSQDDRTASGSFCYTLNLETDTWTKHDTVNVPSYLSGPRFSHSAVLVNTTLFILFGRGADGKLNPSLLTIDVANVSNILYTAIYAPNTAGNSSDSNSNDSNSDDSNSDDSNSNGFKSKESGGLSKGAVGGITGGSVVAVLGIIAFVFLYLRRQKKAKQQDTQENMNVDWDEIENRYKEVPAAKSNPPQLTESTEITENTGGRHYSPNLVATIENSNSFSLPKNKIPDTIVNIVKPSVSSVDDYITVKPDRK